MKQIAAAHRRIVYRTTGHLFGCTTQRLFESVGHNMISLATPRVLTCRVQLAVPTELPIHAVFLQKMVDNDICGIIYTSNPLQQEKDRMVIASAQELEKGIVSGFVPADEYNVAG